jgi:NADH:ubiquinone oxidoreductase subunit 6 (subunit J)
MMSFLFNVFAGLALLSGVMVIRAKNPVYSVLFLILVFCNASGLLILINLDFFAMVFLVVYVGAIAVLFLFVVMMLNIKLAEINDNILRYLPIGGMFGLLFLGEILLLLEQDLVPVMLSHTQGLLPFFEWCMMMATCVTFGAGSILWIAVFHPTTMLSVCVNWGVSSIQLMQMMEVYKSITLRDGSGDAYDTVDYVIWPHTLEQTTTIHTLGHVVYTSYMVFFIMASVILLISMIGAIVLTMHKGVFVKRQEVFEQNTRDFSKTLHKIKNK